MSTITVTSAEISTSEVTTVRLSCAVYYWTHCYYCGFTIIVEYF